MVEGLADCRVVAELIEIVVEMMDEDELVVDENVVMVDGKVPGMAAGGWQVVFGSLHRE